MKRVVFTTEKQTVVHASKSGTQANILMGLTAFFARRLSHLVGVEAATKAVLIVLSGYADNLHEKQQGQDSLPETTLCDLADTGTNPEEKAPAAEEEKKPVTYTHEGKTYTSFTEYMNAKSASAEINAKPKAPKAKKTGAKPKTE